MQWISILAPNGPSAADAPIGIDRAPWWRRWNATCVARRGRLRRGRGRSSCTRRALRQRRGDFLGGAERWHRAWWTASARAARFSSGYT